MHTSINCINPSTQPCINSQSIHPSNNPCICHPSIHPSMLASIHLSMYHSMIHPFIHHPFIYHISDIVFIIRLHFLSPTLSSALRMVESLKMHWVKISLPVHYHNPWGEQVVSSGNREDIQNGIM